MSSRETLRKIKREIEENQARNEETRRLIERTLGRQPVPGIGVNVNAGQSAAAEIRTGDVESQSPQADYYERKLAGEEPALEHRELNEHDEAVRQERRRARIERRHQVAESQREAQRVMREILREEFHREARPGESFDPRLQAHPEHVERLMNEVLDSPEQHQARIEAERERFARRVESGRQEQAFERELEEDIRLGEEHIGHAAAAAGRGAINFAADAAQQLGHEALGRVIRRPVGKRFNVYDAAIIGIGAAPLAVNFIGNYLFPSGGTGPPPSPGPQQPGVTGPPPPPIHRPPYSSGGSPMYNQYMVNPPTLPEGYAYYPNPFKHKPNIDYNYVGDYYLPVYGRHNFVRWTKYTENNAVATHY